MDAITALAPLVGNIGVPAALCFYTLFEVNKNLKRLTNAFNKLVVQLRKQNGELQDEESQEGELL